MLLLTAFAPAFLAAARATQRANAPPAALALCAAGGDSGAGASGAGDALALAPQAVPPAGGTPAPPLLSTDDVPFIAAVCARLAAAPNQARFALVPIVCADAC
jgi:hypothetical protein